MYMSEIRHYENPRLNRNRNRLINVGFAVIGVLSAWQLISIAEDVSASDEQELLNTPTVERVVQPGDTIWGFAVESNASDGDPHNQDTRVLVDVIKEINPRIKGSVIYPGDIIFIPDFGENDG